MYKSSGLDIGKAALGQAVDHLDFGGGGHKSFFDLQAVARADLFDIDPFGQIQHRGFPFPAIPGHLK
jgi:hypothetical protein